MECPFCAETVKDEAIACKHCSRDLRVVRPVILEIQHFARELDKLRRDLAMAGFDHPAAPVWYVIIRFGLAIGCPLLFIFAASPVLNAADAAAKALLP